MADNDEKGSGNNESTSFKVTVEDCAKWTSRLQRMAKALENREQNEVNAEGIKMFYTASVLMQRLGMEIQQDLLFSDSTNLFGNGHVGEA